eukprot:gene32407-31024_t
MSQANLKHIMSQANLKHIMSQANLKHIMSQAKLKHIMSQANLKHIMSQASLKNLMSQANLKHIMSQANLKHIMSQANLRNLMSQANLKHIMSQANLKHILSQANLKHIISQANMKHIMSQASLKLVMSQANLKHILSQANFCCSAGSAHLSPSSSVTTDEKPSCSWAEPEGESKVLASTISFRATTTTGFENHSSPRLSSPSLKPSSSSAFPSGSDRLLNSSRLRSSGRNFTLAGKPMSSSCRTFSSAGQLSSSACRNFSLAGNPLSSSCKTFRSSGQHLSSSIQHLTPAPRHSSSASGTPFDAHSHTSSDPAGLRKSFSPSPFSKATSSAVSSSLAEDQGPESKEDASLPTSGMPPDPTGLKIKEYASLPTSGMPTQPTGPKIKEDASLPTSGMPTDPTGPKNKEEASGSNSLAPEMQTHSDWVLEESFQWLEITAIPILDPSLLLLQTDISQRAELETRMAALTEGQLDMLQNMFPCHVLEYMVMQQHADMSELACSHSAVTIMFMDIVGFTSMSKEVSSQAVMAYLNDMFTQLDDKVSAYGVYKVDTAGDCYIVAGGLMIEDEDGAFRLDPNPDPEQGARRVLQFVQGLMAAVTSVPDPASGNPSLVRVGIHTGSCVSGLIGTKLPKFSLWGDTMNTASRMESTSKPGHVQVSQATYDLLDDSMKSIFTSTGGVEVKGKGMMRTYAWDTINNPHTAPSSVAEDAGYSSYPRSPVNPINSSPADSLPMEKFSLPAQLTADSGTHPSWQGALRAKSLGLPAWGEVKKSVRELNSIPGGKGKSMGGYRLFWGQGVP